MIVTITDRSEFAQYVNYCSEKNIKYSVIVNEKDLCSYATFGYLIDPNISGELYVQSNKNELIDFLEWKEMVENNNFVKKVKKPKDLISDKDIQVATNQVILDLKKENEELKKKLKEIEDFCLDKSVNDTFSKKWDQIIDRFFTPKPTQLAKELLESQNEETRKAMFEILRNTLNQEE